MTCIQKPLVKRKFKFAALYLSIVPLKTINNTVRRRVSSHNVSDARLTSMIREGIGPLHEQNSSGHYGS